MPRALLIALRFHDGRYHGAGDWPPSPARLFQALVAGAAEGDKIPQNAHNALAWLEVLDPPAIATPTAWDGQDYQNYVPNNDLDAKGGDPARIAEIRVPKQIRPRLFDAETPLLYCWQFENDPDGHAHALVEIAERLFQFGRGVDMAWAQAELLGMDEAKRRLEEHGAMIHRPTGGNGIMHACPGPGSLKTLIVRHKAMGKRVQRKVKDKKTQYVFTQPPKPRFRQVAYDSPPTRRLYDLRDLARNAEFQAWPLTEIVTLTKAVRDKAATRLADALPNKGTCIERVFGRVHDLIESDKAQRIRITPLPSIGHQHAESSIRRVLVEIPPNCPLPVRDLEWAFSGLHLGSDPETGEILDESLPMLVESDDWRMPDHYGVRQNEKQAFCLWRTVTPAALPERAARRRIDPTRMGEEAKGAKERLEEETKAADAVHQALRHAGIDTPVEAVRVQREPLVVKGARADAFAPGTRFSKRRLWHVEVAFTEPRSGSVVIGDGRYLGLGLMAPDLGLGLMAPVRDALRDHMVFPLSPELPVATVDAPALMYAVRRALMALSRDGEGKVPRLFSGHEADGAPARSNRHEHIFLAVDDTDNDGLIDRLIVAAPWVCDRTMHAPHPKRALFDRVVCKLRHVRAGRLGVIFLDRPSALLNGDPLVGPAQAWESRTPYRPTRHASRGKDPATAVMQDAITECVRRGLPRPEIEVLKLDAGPNGGNLAARLCLRFAAAQEGPILLGRDSHMGGGLFATTDEDGRAGR